MRPKKIKCIFLFEQISFQKEDNKVAIRTKSF